MRKKVIRRFGNQSLLSRRKRQVLRKRQLRRRLRRSQAVMLMFQVLCLNPKIKEEKIKRLLKRLRVARAKKSRLPNQILIQIQLGTKRIKSRSNCPKMILFRKKRS